MFLHVFCLQMSKITFSNKFVMKVLSSKMAPSYHNEYACHVMLIVRVGLGYMMSVTHMYCVFL